MQSIDSSCDRKKTRTQSKRSPRHTRTAIKPSSSAPISSTERAKAKSSSYTGHLEPGRRSQLVWIAIKSSRGNTDLAPESVAEYTKRPLLSITAADLGHEPVELERNLLRFFKDASNWDAIVLLDEADVYLERRSVNDLRRNSIVS